MNTSHMMSAKRRPSVLEDMSTGVLDVLVIGGGITGAGIALDASVRGLSVGVVEKQDFAQGTSSRSTKLIHGGLRYLKQGEVGLVREVGRERAILYRNAPHLVKPERMLLPIVQNGTYGYLATSIGLWVYDRLAGVASSERRVMLSKVKTLAAEPLLRADGLRGGGLYYEYRTDDARLTIEVLKTAVQNGALAVNYAEVTEFLYRDGHVVGVRVRDRLNHTDWNLYAHHVVNAAGPWVDELRQRDGSLVGKRLHLTKGVHIVVPYDRLPLRQSVYFDTQDGRMVFAIPRDATTYIGTTDTDYVGSLENPEVTPEDITYLLDAANQMFPLAKLSGSDIQASWAGLRPLIHEDGKSPSELSRKDEMFVSDTGLISIAGGKLTGYRKMAARVVDYVMSEISHETQRPFVQCTTDKVVLSGGQPEVELRGGDISLLSWAESQFIGGLSMKQYVWSKFGSNTPHVLAYIHGALDEVDGHATSSLTKDSLVADSLVAAVAIGELRYCVEHEMVCTVEDFLTRRIGWTWFDRSRLEHFDAYVSEEAICSIQNMN